METSVIETEAALPLPPYTELLGRFPSSPAQKPSIVTRRAKEQAPKFGTVFTDHMAQAWWRADSGWQDLAVVPYGPLRLDPAAAVLHYGQEGFEGLKAYKWEDGSIWTFRPGFNAARLAATSRRLALPELSREDFVGSLVALVNIDRSWVPEAAGSSLYLRPFMFASEAFLGVRPAQEVTFLTIASPAGPYFSSGFKPVSIWVSTSYHRAGPGGMGAAKTGGNYAASLAPQLDAGKRGFDQVCFLDAREEKYLEELGGMNIFVVYADGSVRTPALTGTILEGGTRSAILRLLSDQGVEAQESHIALDQLVQDGKAGKVKEIFACGTAAVVTPIGRLAGEGFSLELPAGDLTTQIHRRLTDIQYGRAEDPHGWCYRLA